MYIFSKILARAPAQRETNRLLLYSLFCFCFENYPTKQDDTKKTEAHILLASS